MAEAEGADDGEATDLLVEREAGRVIGVTTCGLLSLLADREAGRVGVEVATAAGEESLTNPVLLGGRVVTEREAERVAVAVAAGEAALVGVAVVLVGGRPAVTDREAGRVAAGVGMAEGDLWGADVTDLLAVRVGVWVTGETAGDRAKTGIRDGGSLAGSIVGMVSCGCDGRMCLKESMGYRAMVEPTEWWTNVNTYRDCDGRRRNCH